MYFATNPPLATLPVQIAQEFQQLRDASPSEAVQLFALVDGAFDEAFFQGRSARALPRQSLYAGTALQGLGAAVPYLLTAPEGAEARLAWLSQLFAACGAKPMLSILACVLNADELVRHFRPYLIAITPDTVEWPVRWGDTRVLPMLLDALTEPERGQLLAPMTRWWWPGRDGALRSWQGKATLPAPVSFDKMPMGDEVFAKLVEMSEADAVLANLYDSQPDLFRTDSPAQCHARVARHLRVASANGIHAAPARQHFSALALLLSDDFTQHPAMTDLLRRTRQGADYNDGISALSGEFWRTTER